MEKIVLGAFEILFLNEAFAITFPTEFIKIYNFLKDFKHWAFSLLSFTPNVSFLSDIAAIEAVLIGVTIPISLQVVTWAAERYRDLEISKIFIKERLYRAQYFLLLPNIIIVIALKFADISNKYLLWGALLWLIINVVVFYKFIRRVEQYAANTENYLLKRLRKNIENILQE